MDELNMNVLFSKMGEQLGIKLSQVGNKQERFKNFQMSAQRRRLLKKKMEEDMERNLFEVVQKLCGVLEAPIPDPEGMFYFCE
jgi:hypothetical protein